MTDISNAKDMRRNTSSKIPAVFEIMGQHDWDKSMRENLPLKIMKNRTYKQKLSLDVSTDRSLPEGWNMGAGGPSTVTYVASGDGATVVLNETPVTPGRQT